MSTATPPPHWSRVKEIAFEALDQEAAQRGAFLDSACEGDTALRAEVEKLIRAHEAAEDGGFLDPPSLPDLSSGPVSRPVNDPMTLVGQRVGRYRVRRLIGVGGMGAVYEAVQEQPRRTVALKVMRSGLASRSALRRFEYEAQLLARLRHPGIAQVFEAGAHEGPHGTVPYFAMEYIPGAKPVTEHARGRNLSIREKLGLFASVCEAVQHGHTKGIVHRDLKPSNILVDSSGSPKIIDFGVARATDSDLAVTTLQTDVGQLVGTLQYMSPEQCAADPNDIDTRSDVYSLGVVLYELLTGKPPYDITGVPIYEAPRIIREQPPARPSGVDAALRGDIQVITLKALEKDRAHRYQSAQELALDLRRYLAGEAISARPPSVIYQLRVFTRRHRPLVLGLSAVLAALVLGVIGSAVGFSHAIQARDLARSAADDAKAQAARAAKIADFLKATLGSADPTLAMMAGAGRGPGGNDDISPWERVWRGPWEYAGQPGHLPTVADLLLVAAKRLDQTFPDDPSIQAELGALIGRALVGYGAIHDAIEVLERALRIQRQTLGLKSEETLATMTVLAACHGLQNRWDLAESILKEAHEACVRAFGRTDARTLEVGRQRTENLMQVGDRRAEALTLQRETVALLERLLGPEDPQTLTETYHLASLLESAGRWDEAEPLARRALEGLRKMLGSSRRATIDATATLAHILRTKGGAVAAGNPDAATRGWLEEAEGLQRGVVAFYESSMGRDFSGTNELRKAQIEMLMVLGRFDQAEPVARAIMDSEIRVSGNDSLQTAKARARLARVMAAGKLKLDEAEELARKSAERTWRITAEREDYAVYHKATLAAVLRARGHADEARTLTAPLWKDGRDPPTRNSPWVTAFVGSVLGECLIDAGAYDEARSTLMAAMSDADDWGDPSSAIRIGVIRAIVRLHETQGNAAEAAVWRKKLPSLAESGVTGR